MLEVSEMREEGFDGFFIVVDFFGDQPSDMLRRELVAPDFFLSFGFSLTSCAKPRQPCRNGVGRFGNEAKQMFVMTLKTHLYLRVRSQQSRQNTSTTAAGASDEKTE